MKVTSEMLAENRRANKAAQRERDARAPAQLVELRAAVLVMLDCIDYTAHPPACRQTEMIGAVLPAGLLARLRGLVE